MLLRGASCLELEVSFVFVSSAAALILLSPAGAEEPRKCRARNLATFRLGVVYGGLFLFS